METMPDRMRAIGKPESTQITMATVTAKTMHAVTLLR